MCISNELAMQAFALATSRSGIKQTIFHPFEAFATLDANGESSVLDPSKNLPIGCTSRLEAMRVGWLMSCVPHLANSTVKVATEALTACTEAMREYELALELYNELCSSAGNVKIFEFETRMNAKCAPIDLECDGMTKRMDPYGSSVFVEAVRASVAAHVADLDVKLSRMHGVEASQSVLACDQDMRRVCSEVASVVTKMLMNRSVDSVSLTASVANLSEMHSSRHVTLLKTKLTADRSAAAMLVRLSYLCDAFSRQCDLLQAHDQEVAHLLCFPPTCLQHALESRGVCTRELVEVLKPLAGCVRDSTVTPPTPTFVVHQMIARWIRSHKASVVSACTEAINAIDEVIGLGYTHPVFSGVKIVTNNEAANMPTADALQRDILPRREAWACATHLEFPNRVLACFCETSFGLRPCRLFAVLLEEIKFGLLPVFTVKASEIRAVVSRVISERDLRHSECVKELRRCGEAAPFIELPTAVPTSPATAVVARTPSKRPLSPPCAVAFRAEKAPTYSDRVRGVHRNLPLVSAAAPPSAAPPNAAPPPKPSKAKASTSGGKPADGGTSGKLVLVPADETAFGSSVPLELRRAHAVLVAVFECIKAQPEGVLKVTVTVEEAVEQLQTFFSDMRTKSSASLTQQAASEMRELVTRIQTGQEALALEVSYVHERSSVSAKRTTGICMTVVGRKGVAQYVAHALVRMRHDPEFAKEWFTNASARAYAKRVAKKM